MRTLDVVVGCVSTWRITHLLLYENGPFRLLRRLRERSGVVYEHGDSNVVTSFQYEITTCPWCLSMWVGAVVTLLLSSSSLARWLLLPFTFSAASVYLGKILEKQIDVPNFPTFEVGNEDGDSK